MAELDSSEISKILAYKLSQALDVMLKELNDNKDNYYIQMFDNDNSLAKIVRKSDDETMIELKCENEKIHMKFNYKKKIIEAALNDCME